MEVSRRGQIVPNRSQAALEVSVEGNDNNNDSASRHGGPALLEKVVPDVLYQSDNYVIINKPHDLRMDGDFDVTVEKMLRKYLQKQTKWVHQLDYATSGVLCVALNKAAAAQATAAFENRCTAKVYLAVVHGHLFPTSWPSQEEAELKRQTLPFNHSATEEKLKLKKKISSTCEKQETWQDRALQISVDQHLAALSTLLSCPVDPSAEKRGTLRISLEELGTHSREDFMVNKKLRKLLRKVVSACGVSIAEVDQEQVKASMPPILRDSSPSEYKQPEEMLHWSAYGCIYHKHKIQLESSPSTSPKDYFYNLVLADLLRAHARGVILDNPEECPCSKRFYKEQSHQQEHSSCSTLHVDIPIADGADNEFRMMLGAGTATSPGRPSHTEITVLEHGLYQGRPVTKLLLRPISGRRHQLRLHTLAIGHPIVGDATYGLKNVDVGVERMMLHAYRLRIDLVDSKGKPLKNPCDGGHLESSTPDPFLFCTNFIERCLASGSCARNRDIGLNHDSSSSARQPCKMRHLHMSL